MDIDPQDRWDSDVALVAAIALAFVLMLAATAAVYVTRG